VDARTGISPRDSMEIVFETCREYARTFSKKSMNLFLSGGTGLGKTFLSTCIARVVSERGFSVVYDTASSIFSKYEQEKFSKNTDDVDRARADIKRLETCDLLIVDDLGTEMPTSFVTSALYTLINTRLMNDRKMVISSNIPMSDLGRRYSAPIMSRLEGEFLVLNFYGRDIRLIKNGL
jgi:DNA replication protein DnaC